MSTMHPMLAPSTTQRHRGTIAARSAMRCRCRGGWRAGAGSRKGYCHRQMVDFDGRRCPLSGRGRDHLAGDAGGLPRLGPRLRLRPALAHLGSAVRAARPVARPGDRRHRRQACVLREGYYAVSFLQAPSASTSSDPHHHRASPAPGPPGPRPAPPRPTGRLGRGRHPRRPPVGGLSASHATTR